MENSRTGVAIRFALQGASDAVGEDVDGLMIYRGGLDGSDVLHRISGHAIEDFVVFETPPIKRQLLYRVDISRTSGLRLVSNTLEFLDEGGTPLLRVAPPYVEDARGARHEAVLAIEGCNFDMSSIAPWGRPVLEPGARHCTLTVSWSDGLAYPAIVDPSWSSTGSMATVRAAHTATLLQNGRVLVTGGGGYSGVLSSVELYDPKSGTFASTGPLNLARGGHTATLLASGKVLVAGGTNSTATPYVLASAELYDPNSGTFAPTASMSVPRNVHAAVGLPSGKVLVTGGYDATGVSSSAELFDPTANSGLGGFVATTPMLTARENHTTSLLASGKVLVVGGDNLSGVLSSSEEFDPAGAAGAGAFSAAGSMVTRRRNHSATTLPSGKVLVAGGFYDLGLGFIYPSTAEIFDPAANAGTGAFVMTGKMTSPHAYHPAVLLPAGKVLITAGIDGPNFSGSTESFDPAANNGAGAFSLAGAILPRNGHAACLLPSGSVLLTGGYSAQTTFDSALVFDGSLGDPCSQPGYCHSGHCVDGICCDQACGGACETCLGAFKQSGGDGTCGFVKDGADPRNECAAGNAVCLADGQCNGSGACRAAAPAGTVCGPRLCSGSGTKRQVCDGLGNCNPDDVVENCAPFRCVQGACPTICASNDDCVADAWCRSGACTTSKGSNGEACADPSACASGFCPDGYCREVPCADCTPVSTDRLGGGGGCSLGMSDGTGPPSWLVALGVLNGFARWRRRRIRPATFRS